MKIQQVVINEFKNLLDVDQELNGNNFFILGENGVGKSSFMQFIQIALGNQTNIPKDAKGSGYVITDKEGKQFIFNVKIKDGKSVVTVSTPDGMKDNRKSALASIVGAIDFDIDYFVSLSKTKKGQKEQVEIFKSKLEEETREQLKKYEVNIEVAYNERTEVNRQITEIKAFINSNPLKNENLQSIKQVDVSALSQQKESIRQRLNELYKTNKATNDAIRKSYDSEKEMIIKEVGEHNKKQADNTVKYNECVNALSVLVSHGLDGTLLGPFIKSMSEKILPQKIAQELYPEEPKYIQELPDNKELKEVEDKILLASDANVKYNEAQSLLKKIKLLEELEVETGDLTVKIEAGRQAISDCIKDMSSPVSGLSYVEDSLVYNGVPVTIDNLSTSEIIELGVKLKMAENPGFEILFIQRGESLGAKRLAEIMELANKNNWQVLMEQVQRGTEKLTFEIIKGEE